MKSQSTSPALATEAVVLVIPHCPAADRPPKFEIGPYVPALLAAAVAALGWITVERFARRRERRADIRALIQTFSDQVQRIVDEAIRYYALPGNAAEAMPIASAMKANVQSLAEHLDVLRDIGLVVDFTDDLKRFRQAVTGGEFESQTRVAQPATSQLAAKIASQGQALIGVVRLKLFRELAGTSVNRARPGTRS